MYDLIFLVVFCLIITLFLFKNRKNLGREGIIFLYRTQLGVKLIKKIGEKYKRTLNVLQYIIIGIGYLLMAGILLLIGNTVYNYIKYPLITELIRAPPIAPVIPYFPQLFGMESFFPPFYFTYFLVAIAVVMVSHEFFHGIFMKFHNIRIKSTGLVFLGPILGAFVEQNEKDMNKAPKKSQLSVLGAGVFANLILAIIFFLLWWGLFSISFAPAGAIFTGYTTHNIDIDQIEKFGGIDISTREDLINIIENGNFEVEFTLENREYINMTRMETQDRSYFAEPGTLKMQLQQDIDYVIVYGDYPAIKNGLRGTITEVEGNKIETFYDLTETMENFNPGEEINIKTKYEEELFEYELILGEDPDREGRSVMGISYDIAGGLMRMEESMAFFRTPFTDYKANSEFAGFIYYLLFWLFLISFLVALFNMLPVSILDGGRFFYLTIWGLTGSEKVGKAAYKTISYLILASFLVLMLVWIMRIL